MINGNKTEADLNSNQKIFTFIKYYAALMLTTNVFF